MFNFLVFVTCVLSTERNQLAVPQEQPRLTHHNSAVLQVASAPAALNAEPGLVASTLMVWQLAPGGTGTASDPPDLLPYLALFLGSECHHVQSDP